MSTGPPLASRKTDAPSDKIGTPEKLVATMLGTMIRAEARAEVTP